MIFQLDSGAFSNVFEARDSTSGMKIALKVAQKKVNQVNKKICHKPNFQLKLYFFSLEINSIYTQAL